MKNENLSSDPGRLLPSELHGEPQEGGHQDCLGWREDGRVTVTVLSYHTLLPGRERVGAVWIHSYGLSSWVMVGRSPSIRRSLYRLTSL